MTSFGPVAPYYDELMKPVPYRMWVGYYLLLLSHQDIHPRKVLDVCCGTGTMCEMLAQESFEMTGFDLSAEMIEMARKKARKNHLDIRYECMDAAEFELGEKFDAAFSFFDSLNNIIEPDRLQMAMRQVSKHLVPGGSFIFDVNTAFAFETQLFDQQNLKPTAKLRYKWEGDYNPETRIITVEMQFWRGDEAFTETHRQRAYTDHEIREMLDNAGFEQVKAYHSYTLNPPRFKSDRVHYTAVKGC
jgi:ubiquinone/menaquinone biosynthesis C-methylase UbiE